MLSETRHSDSRKTSLALGLLPFLLAACTGMRGFMSLMTQPELMPSDKVTFLTYDALNGLEVGHFWVRPGESSEQRAARFSRRIRRLAEVQPDLILLQEVNPLPDMAEDYIRALVEMGFQYAEVHQLDAWGLRLAPVVAILPGLNNGLVFLTEAPLRVRKLEGLKLSGGIGGCHDFWDVQFGELLYALIAYALGQRARCARAPRPHRGTRAGPSIS